MHSDNYQLSPRLAIVVYSFCFPGVFLQVNAGNSNKMDSLVVSKMMENRLAADRCNFRQKNLPFASNNVHENLPYDFPPGSPARKRVLP